MARETLRVLPTRVKWEDWIMAKRSRSECGRSRCNDASLVQHMAGPELNYNEDKAILRDSSAAVSDKRK
jgi:hypothetical protein